MLLLSERINYLNEIFGKTNDTFFKKFLEATLKYSIEIEQGIIKPQKTSDEISKRRFIITDADYRPMYFSERDNRLFHCESKKKVGRKSIHNFVKAYPIQQAEDYVIRSMKQIAENNPLTEKKDIDYKLLRFEI